MILEPPFHWFIRTGKVSYKDVVDSTFHENFPTKIWTVGFGDGSGMLESVQRITEKALNETFKFDYTIRIPIPSVIDSSGGTNAIQQTEKNAVLRLAIELDLIDDSTLILFWLIQKDEANYNDREYKKFEFNKIRELKKKINKKLLGKRCLIIVENLLHPLSDPINEWLMEGWLPLPVAWDDSSSWWLISTPSREICAQSRVQFDRIVDPQEMRDDANYLKYVILREELGRIARSISSELAGREVMEDMLWSCLLYTLLLNGDEKQKQNENPIGSCIGAKELIRFWISEGLFTRSIKLDRTLSSHNNMMYFQLALENKKEYMITSIDKLFELAQTILEALLSNSMLQSCCPRASSSLPSPNTCIVSFSGMWQLIYQKTYGMSFNRVGLLTKSDFSDPSKLAGINWVSFATESCKWIELYATGIHSTRIFPHSTRLFPIPSSIPEWPTNTTTLTLRGRKEISQPIIETLIFHMPCLRVLDLSYTSIKSLPPSIACLANLRFLSMKHCQNMISLAPDLSTSSPIATLEKIEVLDLHGVPLIEIPDDLSHKKSRIYYLDLSCPTITSLPFNIFSGMESLRELVFLGCQYLTNLPLSIMSLANLVILSVSETKLTHLPPDTFKKMLFLRVLKLINNNLLEELPKSLCEAQNLEEIQLNGCRSLLAIEALPIKRLKVLTLIGNDHIVQLPESLSRSHELQEMIVSDCQSLIEIKMIDLVNLKSFSLTHSYTSSLSLHGCRELEIVVLHDLDKLEELDLSGTAIKELPPGISGSKRLRKLDLQAASQLKRVPWHQLDHVPEVLNLDQCEHFTPTIGESDADMMINLDTGVCISVRDSSLFYNLNQENCRRLVAGGSLQSFYILVSSCEKRKENMRRLSQSIQPQTSAACVYKETDYFKNLIHMPPPAQHPRRRHVEISSTEQKPKDLEGILEITESLSVKDNDWLSCLDDLHQTFPRLKDVAVERCQRMNRTFSTAWYGENNVASELLSIRAGHLSQLTTIFYIYSQHEKYFAALKHLYVYNCGKLKSIFSERLLLPNLETLIITYCDKLQTVFDKSSMKPDDIENKLQNLRKIRFEELPQMRHIYDCDKHRVGPLHAPQWKTLYFRGCWSLCRLPFLEGPRDQQVCVDGEVSQCKKIKMRMKAEELFHYKFKSPPPVASKKSINNRIFLK